MIIHGFSGTDSDLAAPPGHVRPGSGLTLALWTPRGPPPVPASSSAPIRSQSAGLAVFSIRRERLWLFFRLLLGPGGSGSGSGSGGFGPDNKKTHLHSDGVAGCWKTAEPEQPAAAAAAADLLVPHGGRSLNHVLIKEGACLSFYAHPAGDDEEPVPSSSWRSSDLLLFLKR